MLDAIGMLETIRKLKLLCLSPNRLRLRWPQSAGTRTRLPQAGGGLLPRSGETPVDEQGLKFARGSKEAG